MSWVSRVRDNAQARRGGDVLNVNFQPAATLVGHFRPAIASPAPPSPSHAVPLEALSHVPSPPTDASLNVGGATDPVHSDSPEVFRSTLLEVQDSSWLHTVGELSSHPHPQQQQSSHNTTRPPFPFDAHAMDPFAHRERAVGDALEAARRQAGTIALETVDKMRVVLAPCVVPTTPIGRTSMLDTPIPAADPNSAKAKPHAVAAIKGGRTSVTPVVDQEHQAAVVVRALQEQKLISQHPRIVTVAELRELVKKLQAVVTSKQIDTVTDGRLLQQPVTSVKSATPSTSALPPKKSGRGGGADTAPPDGAIGVDTLVAVPPEILELLSECMATYKGILTKKTSCVDTLMCFSSSDCSPIAFSRGLSLAAREVGQLLGQPKFTRLVPPANPCSASSSSSSLQATVAPPSAIEEAIRLPCGEFLLQRVVERYGQCDVPKLSGFAVYGKHAAQHIARHWLVAAAAAASEVGDAPYPAAKALVKPNRVVVGVGWQKHPVFGAVTVCLACSSFQDLQFTEQRTNLPMREISRYILNDLLRPEERNLFPIKCEPSRFQIKAVSPTMHPILAPSRDVEICFSVPPNVEISASLVQLDAPPETPFFGKRFEVDHLLKDTRRRGKQSLLEVPQEPRCSTQATLVDYLPHSGLTRIRVRLPTAAPTTLHVFARMAPLETSFIKAVGVLIQPTFDPAADGDVTPLPVVSEVFQRWRGCLVQPVHKRIEVDDPTEFEVHLPASVTKCMLKGAHGETAMERGEPAPASVIVQDEGNVIHGRPLLPNAPTACTTAASSPTSAPTPTPGRASYEKSATLHGTKSALSPLRPVMPSETVLYRALVQRPAEGTLQLWVDGFLLCTWIVVF